MEDERRLPIRELLVWRWKNKLYLRTFFLLLQLLYDEAFDLALSSTFFVNIFLWLQWNKTCFHLPIPTHFCSVRCSSRVLFTLAVEVHLKLDHKFAFWQYTDLPYLPNVFLKIFRLSLGSLSFQWGLTAALNNRHCGRASHMGATCALPSEDLFSRNREEDQPNLFLCLNVSLFLCWDYLPKLLTRKTW